MSENKDLFEALSFFYYVGKIFGSVNYTIKGVPKKRKLVTNNFDKCLILLRFAILSYIILYLFRKVFSIQIIHVYTSFVETFISIILTWSLYSTIFSYLKLSIFDSKVFRNLWMKMNNLCDDLAFRNEEYEHVTKMSIFLETLSYFCVVFYLYSSLSMPTSNDLSFLSSIPFQFLSTALMTDMIVLLFCVYTVSKQLNRKLFLLSLEVSHEAKALKMLIRVNQDLVQLCKEINNISMSLWTGVMISFVALTETVYLLSALLEALLLMDVTLIKIYLLNSRYLGSLAVGHTGPIIIAIFICVITLKEVSGNTNASTIFKEIRCTNCFLILIK